MSEMVEQVAHIVRDMADDTIIDWNAIARAAISTLREPTNDMRKAGAPGVATWNEKFERPEIGAEICWKLMIDEALK